MSTPLRVLIAEDLDDDAELLVRELRRHGYQPAYRRVDTREGMATALATEAWDLVISDYAMPQFGALDALETLKASGLDLPFIIVSGTIDEETAVAALKAGAHDFILKSNPARLIPAITRELREASIRRDRSRTEIALEHSERYHRSLIEHAADMIGIMDSDGSILYMSPAIQRVLGYQPGELIGRNAFELVHGEDRARLMPAFEELLRHPEATITFECRSMHQDRSWRILEATCTNLLSDLAVGGVVINARDITERREAEEAMRRKAELAEALVRVAARLNVELDLDTVVHAVCEEAVRALNVTGAVVSLYDEQSATFPVTAQIGLPPDFAERAHPIPRTVYDLFSFTPASTVVIPDARAETDAPDAALYQELDIRTVASVSMIRSGHLVGLLNVMVCGGVRHFSEDDLASLHGLADQAAQAITTARLFTQARRQLDRVQALRTIDIAITGSFDLRLTLSVVLDQVLMQLGVDAAAIMTLDPHIQVLEYSVGRGFRTSSGPGRLRLGQGYAGRIVLDRRTISFSRLLFVSDEAHADFLSREGFVAYAGTPLISKGQVKGVLEIYHRSPMAFDDEWLGFFETLAGQAALAVDSAELFERLQRSNANLILSYDTTLEGWVRALDLRDRETEGHTQRVTDLTLRLGRAMGIGDEELAHMRRGALLHDIGKIGVPDYILHKPGPLDDDEWAIMRKHPVYAYEWLSGIPFLRPALDIPYYHHERWDGSGYPHGLKGMEIPLGGRVFAIIDVWDALRSERPYKQPWPVERALAEIKSQAGRHFDPEVVRAFLDLLSVDAREVAE